MKSWKKKSFKGVKNRELWEKMDDLIQNRVGIIQFEKVKGHSNDPGNDIADKLATSGSRKRKTI